MSASNVDWGNVLESATNAAIGVLSNKAPSMLGAAAHQVELLVLTAKFISDNRHNMSEIEGRNIVKQQEDAFMAVLSGFDAISILIAQQALAAASAVIVAALPTALKSVFSFGI